MQKAQDMLHQVLPIKCLEAVVLGLFLTMKIEPLDRVTVSFKSTCQGQIYRHIVLVIKHKDKWGALGLSRKPDLMNKNLEFNSLSDLLRDYQMGYTASISI